MPESDDTQPQPSAAWAQQGAQQIEAFRQGLIARLEANMQPEILAYLKDPQGKFVTTEFYSLIEAEISIVRNLKVLFNVLKTLEVYLKDTAHQAQLPTQDSTFSRYMNNAFKLGQLAILGADIKAQAETFDPILMGEVQALLQVMYAGAAADATVAKARVTDIEAVGTSVTDTLGLPEGFLRDSFERVFARSTPEPTTVVAEDAEAKPIFADTIAELKAKRPDISERKEKVAAEKLIQALQRVQNLEAVSQWYQGKDYSTLSFLQYKLKLTYQVIPLIKYLMEVDVQNQLSRNAMVQLLGYIGEQLPGLYMNIDQLESLFFLKEHVLAQKLDSAFENYRMLAEKYNVDVEKTEKGEILFQKTRNKEHAQQIRNYQQKWEMVAEQQEELKPLLKVLNEYGSVPLVTIPVDKLIFIKDKLHLLPLDPETRQVYLGYLDDAIRQATEQPDQSNTTFMMRFYYFSTEMASQAREVAGNMLGVTYHASIVAKTNQYAQQLIAEQREYHLQYAQHKARMVGLTDDAKDLLILASKADAQKAEEQKPAATETTVSYSQLAKNYRLYLIQLLEKHLDNTVLEQLRGDADSLGDVTDFVINDNDAANVRNFKFLFNLFLTIEKSQGLSGWGKVRALHKLLGEVDKDALKLMLQQLKLLENLPDSAGILNGLEREFGLQAGALNQFAAQIRVFVYGESTEQSMLSMVTAQLDHGVAKAVAGAEKTNWLKQSTGQYELRESDDNEERRAKLLLNGLHLLEKIMADITENKGSVIPLLKSAASVLGSYHQVDAKGDLVKTGVAVATGFRENNLVELMKNIIRLSDMSDRVGKETKLSEKQTRELYNEFLFALEPLLGEMFVYLDAVEENMGLKSGTLMQQVEPIWQLYREALEQTGQPLSENIRTEFATLRNQKREERIEQLQARISDVEGEYQHFEKLKRLLYQPGAQLTAEDQRFLTEGLEALSVTGFIAQFSSEVAAIAAINEKLQYYPKLQQTLEQQLLLIQERPAFEVPSIEEAAVAESKPEEQLPAVLAMLSDESKPRSTQAKISALERSFVDVVNFLVPVFVQTLSAEGQVLKTQKQEDTIGDKVLARIKLIAKNILHNFFGTADATTCSEAAAEATKPTETPGSGPSAPAA